MTGEPPAGRDELPDPHDFLPPASGTVAGVRQRSRRALADLSIDLREVVVRRGRRLDGLARCTPVREILVLSIYRPGSPAIHSAVRELGRSRHSVRITLGSTGERRGELGDLTLATELQGGKFQNLNALLPLAGGEADWTLVVDDDVDLPAGFLDRFIGLCEAFGLALAQPAQTQMSHAAWPVTRRRGGSLLRETRFVEIGPVTAFSREAADALMPFPDLRYGWGLDSHWAAVAAQRGWRLGIADAVAVRHERAPVATAYPHEEAVAEARRFLAKRPYVPLVRAAETVTTHRRIPLPARRQVSA